MKITLTPKEAVGILERHFSSALNINLSMVEIEVEGMSLDIEQKKIVVDKAIHLLESGTKIDAVKYLRKVTGLGLKESKDIADCLDKGMSFKDVELMFVIHKPEYI